MNKDTAIKKIRKICAEKARMIDWGPLKPDGYSRGIVTEAGYFIHIVYCHQPIIGPIQFSSEQFAKIRQEAKKAGCNKIEDCEDLDIETRIFFYNKGKVNTEYWAYQPYECAPPREIYFTESKEDAESEYISDTLGYHELIAWNDSEADENEIILIAEDLIALIKERGG